MDEVYVALTFNAQVMTGLLVTEIVEAIFELEAMLGCKITYSCKLI